MKCLTFLLRGVEFAVSVEAVQGVVEYSGATAVPSPLDCLIGVVDLRGEVLPVIDLGMRLGLGRAAGGGRPAVVLLAAGIGSAVMGALVDEVREVVAFPWDRPEEGGAASELGALLESFVTGVARHEGRLIVMLDAARLFSVEELAEMSDA
jgi:purine-binding chemotaxis protein CheW